MKKTIIIWIFRTNKNHVAFFHSLFADKFSKIQSIEPFIIPNRHRKPKTMQIIIVCSCASIACKNYKTIYGGCSFFCSVQTGIDNVVCYRRYSNGLFRYLWFIKIWKIWNDACRFFQLILTLWFVASLQVVYLLSPFNETMKWTEDHLTKVDFTYLLFALKW